MESLPNRRHLTRIPVWLKPDQSVIYFVTVCCADRRPVFNNVQAVGIAVDALIQTAQRTDWSIPQVCFMPDHIHLMMLPLHEREQPLSGFIQRWKSSVKQRLNRQCVDGKIWQREFFDHLLRSGESLTEKWRYVEMNPVRAGLCEKPEDYTYLGAPGEILARIKVRKC